MRMLAVGERRAQRRGRREAGGDAVDDLDLDAQRAQVLGLFATTAEDARVTALEPHHAFAFQRFGSHQLLDEGLRRACAAAALAHVDDARRRPGVAQHRRPDQIVDQQHRGPADGAHGLDRQQLRVARPGADEAHAAARPALGVALQMHGRGHAMRSFTGA